MASLTNIGSSDALLHEIVEKDGEKTQERDIFPITRYANVLNRPKVLEPGALVKNANNPDFLLVATSEEEVDDNMIYDFFNQNW